MSQEIDEEMLLEEEYEAQVRDEEISDDMLTPESMLRTSKIELLRMMKGKDAVDKDKLQLLKTVGDMSLKEMRMIIEEKSADNMADLIELSKEIQLRAGGGNPYMLKDPSQFQERVIEVSDDELNTNKPIEDYMLTQGEDAVGYDEVMSTSLKD